MFTKLSVKYVIAIALISSGHVCCQFRFQSAILPFVDPAGYTETGDRPGRFMDTLYANLNALTLQLEDKTTGNG